MRWRRVVRLRALAKINLSLEVVGVRRDGYHELRSVFQSIALHDTLTFRAARGPLQIASDDPACPSGVDNLVWRAADAVWKAVNRHTEPRDVAVRIMKRIPMRAGLGGGSSDAAAAIRGLAALWRIPLSPDRQRLIARTLGADVPFFVEGGTTLGVDRGDRLKPLADVPAAWVVVVVPPFGVSTTDAYGWWDEVEGRTPVLMRPSARKGRRSLGNDLQEPVAAHHPEIRTIVESLRSLGASHAAMTGSGSAVFGLFDRRSAAAAAGRSLSGGRGKLFVTRTVGRAEYARLARIPAHRIHLAFAPRG